MSLSTRLKATAIRLTNKYGELAAVSRAVYGEFDPATGTNVQVDVIAFNVAVVPFPYVRQTRPGFGGSSASESQVLDTDITLYINAGEGEVKVDDKIIYDNFSYTVVNVDTIRAQGLNILYQCQCRL